MVSGNRDGHLMEVFYCKDLGQKKDKGKETGIQEDLPRYLGFFRAAVQFNS